jgi:hypothetical protein
MRTIESSFHEINRKYGMVGQKSDNSTLNENVTVDQLTDRKRILSLNPTYENRPTELFDY